MIQGTSKVLVTIVFACLVTTAQAIPVNFSIEGTVNSTLGMNQFGLNVGDNISAIATFDDNLITAIGDSNVEFGSNGNAFGSSLIFNIGSVSFNETDDIDFTSEFPTLFFSDGLFDGFDFAGSTFVAGGLEFFGSDSILPNDNITIEGNWNIDTLSLSPVTNVPEPSSMILLGLGVIGLFGFSNKENT